MEIQTKAINILISALEALGKGIGKCSKEIHVSQSLQRNVELSYILSHNIPCRLSLVHGIEVKHVLLYSY